MAGCWPAGAFGNDREYRFVVHVAAAAHPGIETQNADERAATADAEQPEAPELAVRVV